jgi:hypothetical protein
MIPKIVEREKRFYLTLLSKRAKNKKKDLWSFTKSDNLYFINIETDKIDFVIYNSDLFLGFEKDFVYFLRRNQIHKMRWGALETESTISRKDKFGVEFEELQFKQESVNYFECNCG